MYRVLFILLALLATAAGLLVGTLNSDPVTLDLLWFQLSWPLGLVVVLMFASGLLLGVVATWLFAVLPQRLAARRAANAARADANGAASGHA